MNRKPSIASDRQAKPWTGLAKPLRWEERTDTWVAQSVLGEFSVDDAGGYAALGGGASWEWGGPDSLRPHDGRAAAEAACQEFLDQHLYWALSDQARAAIAGADGGPDAAGKRTADATRKPDMQVDTLTAARGLMKGGSYATFAPAFTAMEKAWGEGPDRAFAAALRALVETLDIPPEECRHNPDPVAFADGEWWFWDETWSTRMGPYASEGIARTKLSEYARDILGNGPSSGPST